MAIDARYNQEGSMNPDALSTKIFILARRWMYEDTHHGNYATGWTTGDVDFY